MSQKPICKYAILEGGDSVPVPFGIGNCLTPEYTICDNPDCPESESEEEPDCENCPHYEAIETKLKPCNSYRNQQIDKLIAGATGIICDTMLIIEIIEALENLKDKQEK